MWVAGALLKVAWTDDLASFLELARGEGAGVGSQEGKLGAAIEMNVRAVVRVSAIEVVHVDFFWDTYSTF